MIIDVLVLAVLLISILIAFFRGFIREVLTIFGLVGACFAAYIFAPMLEPVLSNFFVSPNTEEVGKFLSVIPYPLLAKLLAYGGVFIVFMIVLSLLSHFLSSGAEKIGLGSIDRVLGAIFGLARGLLLVGLLYLPFFYILDDAQKENWFGSTMTHPYLEMTAKGIDHFIPKGAEEKVEEVKEEAPSNIERLIRGAQPDRGDEADDETPAYDKDKREEMDQLFEDVGDE